MSEEFELAHESGCMLTVDLVGKSPEDTFPDEASLSILQPDIVFIVYRLRCHTEVEVSNVEPETDDHERG